MFAGGRMSGCRGIIPERDTRGRVSDCVLPDLGGAGSGLSTPSFGRQQSRDLTLAILISIEFWLLD